MKKLHLLAILLIGLLIASGCKKDDDTTTTNNAVGTISVGDKKFDVEKGDGIIQLINDGNTTTGAITIGGNNSTHTLVLGLSIEYVTADGISGDYENGDNSSSNHIFEPWLTQVTIYTNDGLSNQNYNEPDGTLKVTHNSGNNYSVNFNMAFSDTVTVSGDLTFDFIVQQMK